MSSNDDKVVGDTTKTTTNSTNDVSALQDNIVRKGKNAYYFAHANKPTGPEWDGKAEPKLLSLAEGKGTPTMTKCASFEYHKSNITTYAFLDDGMKVKLYIDLVGVGDKCSEEDIHLEFTDSSLCLTIHNLKEGGTPQCLSFGKLSASITNATYKLKKDRVIVTLAKAVEGVWHTINDKGSPDNEVV